MSMMIESTSHLLQGIASTSVGGYLTARSYGVGSVGSDVVDDVVCASLPTDTLTCVLMLLEVEFEVVACNLLKLIIADIFHNAKRFYVDNVCKYASILLIRCSSAVSLVYTSVEGCDDVLLCAHCA